MKLIIFVVALIVLNFSKKDEISAEYFSEQNVDYSIFPDESNHPLGRCYLKPFKSYCFAAFRRYYFNPKSKKCAKFIYGGCGSENVNRFEDIFDCVNTCNATNVIGTPDLCRLKPEVGQCEVFVKSFYFDEVEFRCKEFNYGGCGGNENRFTKKEDCEQTCEVEVEGQWASQARWNREKARESAL